MKPRHISTKTYGHDVGLSACFRQWRADSHCHFIHGYALAVRLEFAADELDSRNWVVDFGDLKEFKQILQDLFDHKLLVAQDDPLLAELLQLQEQGLAQVNVVEAVGCEAFAKLIYLEADSWLHRKGLVSRVSIHRVEVREHGANSAIYEETA